MRNKREILPRYGQNKGQVTIFIIIAVLIFAGVLAYLTLRGSFGGAKLPASFEPVYTNFLACLESDTSAGISTLESQAGYIYLPEFEQGSQHMPFSSQLNFFGSPVPYWYYVSGNNIEKEQVPTKSEMEDQLALYIEDRVRDCDFNSYYEQGFEISLEAPVAKTNIKDNEVEVDLVMGLSIAKEEESVLVRDHKVTVKSKLGSLYNSAKEVYEKEQDNLFLEEYAIDTLRLYAPVDGVEITCSPLVWNADDVFDELQEGIEANTLTLNTRVDAGGYFDINLPVDNDIRFLNSREWPNTFEVVPSENVLLVANPVGNQPGLGIIGFCYVPYHFVYDVKYPVLVQVSSGEEIFQFPMAVVIEDNNPREALNVSAAEDFVPELCTYKNTRVQVSVKDKQGNPIDADISYGCFGNKCNIGKTTSGFLSEDFPQCVNGYVLASADGFRNAKYLLSTVSSGSVSIIMEKIYNKNVQLKIDGVNYNQNAIISFISDDSATTITYPQQRSAELSEGQYEIQVQIYKNSSINIGATTTEQCIDVPRSGVLGVLGLTEERCFDIEVPAQVISNALAGGGKQNQYILESELISSNTIEINTNNLPLPETIEQLQDNYLLFEDNGLDIDFV